ncbi:unnamed protein product, partial [Medioppia subpectinata]
MAIYCHKKIRKMSDKLTLICFLIVVISAFQSTLCDEETDKITTMFNNRCNNKLEKSIALEYDKCDSEASDSLKETVKKCAKEVCNTDGKFDKNSVCCYATKPNAMFACFERTIAQIEENDAKSKGESKDELHRKNMHNAAKIVVCI